MYDGPRGTAKTTTYWNKLLLLGYSPLWKGARFLVVRKTMKSLKTTALVTLEEKVLPVGHPALAVANRRSADPYYKIGGAEVVTGGMDNPDKFRSLDVDIVVFEEAKECTPEDVEIVTACLRNQAGSYHQAIFPTNPGGPNHHLIRAVRDPENPMSRIKSRHEDNPTLYDEEAGEWTKWSREYIGQTLDSYTGHRLLRDRHGKWAAAEGMAFPEYEEEIHLIDRFEIPKDWRRIVMVDHGYTNPTCIQWFAIDGDGRAYRYRETYYSQRLAEDHAKQAKRLTEDAGETVSVVISDWDAEERAAFEKYWMPTIKMNKDRQAGIQALKARLLRAGDGRPRMFWLRDSLVERDHKLSDSGRPVCSEEEWDGLVWDEAREGKAAKEDIVKKDDHGFDCHKALALYLDEQERPMVVQWI